MTPQFEISLFKDNMHSNLPHYLFSGKLSDDEFEFAAMISTTDFIIGADKKKLLYLVCTDNDKATQFDEKTNEFFTGKKSNIYPSKFVFKDKSLATMREQASQSFIVTAQRELFKKNRFDYLNALSLILNQPTIDTKDDKEAVEHLTKLIELGVSQQVLTEEFYDPELEYRVLLYKNGHIRLNEAQLIIECDSKNNYFLINVLNSLNLRVDARICIARYLQTINQSAKYFDAGSNLMIGATAGVFDSHILIKDHDKRRFVSIGDVELTTFLSNTEDLESEDSENAYIFASYEQAWVYAFKYAPNSDILIGYIKTQ